MGVNIRKHRFLKVHQNWMLFNCHKRVISEINIHIFNSHNEIEPEMTVLLFCEL